MTKTWEIDVGAQQFDLTDGKGVVKVSVRNLSSAPSTAVLDLVVAREIASWFTIEEPQREVGAGATTIYKITVAVPANTDSGEHAVIPRVYTATEAPEETSERGRRILLTVPATATADRASFKLWWLAIPAALVLVAGAVVTAVIVTRPDPPPPQTAPAPTPTDPPSPLPTLEPVPTVPPTVIVPDLTSLSEADVVSALAAANLTPTIKHRHDPAQAGTVVQSLRPGIEVEAGSPIDVEIYVGLSAPTLVSPTDGAHPTRAPDQSRYYGPNVRRLDYPPVEFHIDFTWTQSEHYVSAWRIRIDYPVCHDGGLLPDSSNELTTVWDTVTTPSFSTIRYYTQGHTTEFYQGFYQRLFSCGTETWSVEALDDFGNPGPPSPPRTYWLDQ